jgi:hypothetical protein
VRAHVGMCAHFVAACTITLCVHAGAGQDPIAQPFVKIGADLGARASAMADDVLELLSDASIVLRPQAEVGGQRV